MLLIKNKYFQLFASLFIFSFTGVTAKLAAIYGFGLTFIILLGIQFLLLGAYAIIWQQILKNFTLMTATASKGIVVVLNLIWAAFIFNENINLYNIIGAIIIIIGISIVATGEVADD